MTVAGSEAPLTKLRTETENAYVVSPCVHSENRNHKKMTRLAMQYE